jgi:hypothetical protein
MTLYTFLILELGCREALFAGSLKISGGRSIQLKISIFHQGAPIALSNLTETF